MKSVNPLETVYFINLSDIENFKLSDSAMHIDPTIPLPVQKKDSDAPGTFNMAELTEEQILAGVYLLVEGDITGSILFLLEKDSARKMVGMLMGTQSEGDELTEMEESALKEIGNIITASYLNSLSTLTNLVIYPSVPALCIDMAGAIMSVPAIEFGTMGDKILLIQTKFSEGLDGYFILAPDIESYDKILSSLGM